MIIDMHCHLAFSGRGLVEGSRFSFELQGARGRPGLDSYAAPRLVRSLPFQIIRWKLGIPHQVAPGPELDAHLDRIYAQHFIHAGGIDAIVMLAFDEYYDDSGNVHGPHHSFRRLGTDTYTSNTFARDYCRRRPDRFLFAASIHPYRPGAVEALDEVAEAGAVLIKWLPVHQNIDARDPRTISFLHRAAQLGVPVLVHYGGEMSTANQHPDQMNPRPLLKVLREWPREWPQPTLIVAHAATPSMPWQHGANFHALMHALATEFRDWPIYADISAMSNRPWWLASLAHKRRWRSVQHKLVFGSDFPIPPLMLPGIRRRMVPPVHDLNLSWVGTALSVCRAYGFDESVFRRAGEILGPRIAVWRRLHPA